ncbi:microcystin-dependent protein [Caulobacter ginsengisoli]|uniref:Microcystin-dependent protein n=1 Tax=Caulobacter ginsengisoli TaxID=400775 RepID=A0ABU0IN27_9CAUL|nr:tail fiber protein [Caulobacter ginsengisoli]MDQ0463400.1 microcystin-dependent protein [Caulobacter ginsengisoli]
MTEAYVGEIRMWGGDVAPDGWMFCNGQRLTDLEYPELYTVIGETYGGDGAGGFNLPDLRGRVPVHKGTLTSGQTYQLGQKGGAERVVLTPDQLPVHNHPMKASSGPPVDLPTGAALGPAFGGPEETKTYGTDAPVVALSPAASTIAGADRAHENMQPFSVISFIIALSGSR